MTSALGNQYEAEQGQSPVLCANCSGDFPRALQERWQLRRGINPARGVAGPQERRRNDWFTHQADGRRATDRGKGHSAAPLLVVCG